MKPRWLVFDITRRGWAILFTGWLLASILCISIIWNLKLRQIEDTFQRDSTALYERVRQRLDQNESVLAGVDALFATFPGLNFDGIRGYAAEMLSRYSHLYTVGLQPRVNRLDVSSFELQASKDIRPNYQIRDFNLDGDRVWRKAANRPFYYPVTFMEPRIPAASPVMGLDVYADPKMRKAIDMAIATGKMHSSAPFSLVEGGRGYVLFKVIYDSKQIPEAQHARGQHATKLISLLINGSKLLPPTEITDKSLDVIIFHNDFTAINSSGQLLNLGSKSPTNNFSKLFPQLTFERHFGSTAQPFVMRIEKNVGVSIIDPVVLFGAFGMTGLITVLIAAIYSLRRQNAREFAISNAKLQQEQERAVVTLSSIKDAVIRFDTSGRIEFMNKAALSCLEIDFEPALGSLVELTCPIEQELSKQAVKHPIFTVLETQSSVDLADNASVVTSCGNTLLVEGSISPLFNSTGILTGGVLIFRDMGPVKRRAKAAIEASEQRLREHQRELAHVSRLSTMGEMASGLAHELNQPLTAILSYNQACMRLLSEDDPDLEETIAAMRSASLQAKRAGEIITRLRAFVSKQTTHITGLDLRQVVRNVLVLIGPDLNANNIEITSHLPDKIPLVSADSIQLEQVLMNLIRNAMESLVANSNSQRQIDISISWEQSNIMMAVQDSGTGVSPEALEQLFHPFFTTKTNGMGLGLTICQSIIESFSGSLTVSNNAIGAKFVCTLPIQKQPEAIHA